MLSGRCASSGSASDLPHRPRHPLPRSVGCSACIRLQPPSPGSLPESAAGAMAGRSRRGHRTCRDRRNNRAGIGESHGTTTILPLVQHHFVECEHVRRRGMRRSSTTSTSTDQPPSVGSTAVAFCDFDGRQPGPGRRATHPLRVSNRLCGTGPYRARAADDPAHDPRSRAGAHVAWDLCLYTQVALFCDRSDRGRV